MMRRQCRWSGFRRIVDEYVDAVAESFVEPRGVAVTRCQCRCFAAVDPSSRCLLFSVIGGLAFAVLLMNMWTPLLNRLSSREVPQ